MTALAQLEPVGLAELDAAVALRVREDRKHIIDRLLLPKLFAELDATHRALEIDGRRAFTYDSVYFDTPQLLTLRAHVQRRRRRFKARTRLYVESDACAFEVKLKGARDQTVKHRLPHPADAHGTLTAEALVFLERHAGAVADLRPTLRTRYSRVTLAGPDERVTIDRDLTFGSAGLGSQWAIVETKSPHGRGHAEQVLRRLGSRPVSLSKYVMGAGLTRLPEPPADLRLIARRYFVDA